MYFTNDVNSDVNICEKKIVSRERDRHREKDIWKEKINKQKNHIIDDRKKKTKLGPKSIGHIYRCI